MPKNNPPNQSLNEYPYPWAEYKPFKDNPVVTQLIKDWIAQGRSNEAIHGVLNFFSGKGLVLLATQNTHEKLPSKDGQGVSEDMMPDLDSKIKKILHRGGER